MSERNIETLRRWFEAFNARDIDALLALCDPKIEFHSVFAAVGGAVYHGHEGMRRWHRDLEESWGDAIRLEPEAHFDLGERAFTLLVYHARGERSGADVAMPAAAVAAFRDGRFAHIKAYSDREAALRDLGLTLDELDPLEP